MQGGIWVIDDSCICRERHSPWSRHMYIVKAPTFQHLYTNIKSKLKDLPKWPSLWALVSMVCQATLSITSWIHRDSDSLSILPCQASYLTYLHAITHTYIPYTPLLSPPIILHHLLLTSAFSLSLLYNSTTVNHYHVCKQQIKHLCISNRLLNCILWCKEKAR